MQTFTLTRMVQLGGLAKDAALLRHRPANDRLRERVVGRLASLRGLPRKIGQVIALGEIGEDESPYAALTEGEGIMTLEEVGAAIRRARGSGPEALFAWFDPAGVSASIGQVHRARLHDGRLVAVKVQYPDIEQALDLDLQSLDWLTLPFGGLSRLDAAAYRAEVGAMLRRELDYRAEAAAMVRFRRLAAGIPGLEIPELVPSLSGSDVLVMTWIEGGRVEETRQWNRGERIAAGRTLVETFVRGLVDWRLLHADPHPGNLRFRIAPEGPRVGLLDFGCVKEIPFGAAEGLRRLLQIGLDDRWERPAEEYLACFEAMGFRADLLGPMADRLGNLARLLVEPLVSRVPVDLDRLALGVRMAEVLGSDRFNFRVAGPASLLFVIRAWHGVLTYLRALGAPFVWRDLVERAVGDRPVRLTTPAVDPAPAAECRARFLKVRTTVDGATRVELTFAAHRAAALSDLMPADLVGRLAAAGIDVSAIARQAEGQHFEAGDLFRLEEGSKVVAVWLE